MGELKMDLEGKRKQILQSFQTLWGSSDFDLHEVVELACKISGLAYGLVWFHDGLKLQVNAVSGIDKSQIQLNPSCFEDQTIDASSNSSLFQVIDEQEASSWIKITDDRSIQCLVFAKMVSSEGVHVGSLCVFDEIARELSDDQAEALNFLSRHVMARLELHRAQNSLHQERVNGQKRLERLLDCVPAIVGSWNSDAELTFGNKALCEWLSHPGRELSDKTAAELLDLSHPNVETNAISEILAGNRKTFQTTLPNSAGDLEPKKLELVPDWHEDRIIGFFSLITHSNDSVETEESVEEGRWELRRLLDRLPASIAYWDRNLVNTFVNRTYLEWFGKEREEVDGRHLKEVIGPELYRKNLRFIKKCLEGQAQSFERSFVAHDGDKRFANFRYIPDLQDSEVKGFYVVIFDISERRNTEAELRESRKQLRTVLDNIPAHIGYWNTELCNEFANRDFEESVALGEEEMKGRHLVDILGNSLFEQNLPFIKLVLTGQAQTFDRTIIEASGGVKHTQVTYIPDHREGKVCGFFSLVIDVTARRETELQLFEEKERARVTLSSIVDGVITTDCDDRVTYLNPKAEKMTGWRHEEALGQPVEKILRLFEGVDRVPVLNPITHAFKATSQGQTSIDCVLCDRQGREYGVEDSASSILDVSGHTMGSVIVVHDVSEARTMASKMAHLAQHDSLTNLPNRILLQERLQSAMVKCEKSHECFALVFLDLDHFKTINDSMGHAVGDELLKGISARISTALRASDTVSRQGGDEFILLLTEIGSKEYAAMIVQRILRVVSAPYVVKVGSAECKLNATFSAGISMYPDNGTDVDTLMRRADTAMYLAKQSGRNQYQFFSDDLDEAVMVRHTLLQDMREAIDNGDFFAAFQPKVSTIDRQIVGVEALVRWQKADGSVISPADFIPLAEESGLIVEIGAQILEKGCNQCIDWERMGLRPITMAVNVSAVQLANPDFVQSVSQVIRKTGILPARLELEITESSIMADVDKAAQVLHQLRGLGVRVSLDDFGTGYSSLSYLRRFPLDSLKIDRSFVSDLTTNASTAAIMETICNLGKTLQLQIIAEGVETEEQASLLSTLHCTAMQGYLFSKPVAGSKIAELLDDASDPYRLAA